MDNGKIDQIINKYQGDSSALIQVLLEIQRENHWLSREVLERISEKLGVPLSKVRHVATFYKAFSIIPEGHHEINVCNGTSCHVRGSQRILSMVQELTGIKPGETDSDLKFSLEAVTCLGCCSSGPVLVVDGKHYNGISPDVAESILQNYD